MVWDEGRKINRRCLSHFLFSKPCRDFIPFQSMSRHLTLQRVFMANFQECLKRFISGTENPCFTLNPQERALIENKLSQFFFFMTLERLLEKWGRFGRKATFPVPQTHLKVILGINLKASYLKFNCLKLLLLQQLKVVTLTSLPSRWADQHLA